MIDGSTGNDVMWGGTGADVFVFQTDAGHDRVFGFNADEDMLDFSQTGLSFDQLEIKNYGAVTQVSYGDADVMIFSVSCETLTEDNFIF